MIAAISDWAPELVRDRAAATLHNQLTAAIVGAVEQGALRVGTRLPPHRILAHRLGVSVQTVGLSYKEAERLGYLRSEVGRGTFVQHRASARPDRFVLDRNPTDLIDLSIVRAVYTERHEAAARALLRAMAEDDNGAWMRPCRPVAGLDRHRAAAALWLRRLGVDAPVERILITNGAAQAIFIALATVIQPGDLVLTEELTDHGAIGLASVLGFTVRGLATDAEGVLPDAFAAACSAARVKALVTIPTFGNPARYLASAARRAETAAIAERHGVFVIEDEVFKPLLDEPLPAMSAMVPDLGFFATSFTKSVLTGLRTGYLVVPARFAIRAASILRVSSWSAVPLAAEMATRWIENGEAEALLGVQRAEIAARQAILAETLGPAIVNSHSYAPSAWVALPEHWTEEGLTRTLFARGVAVTPSDPFLAGTSQSAGGIRVCLGGHLSHERLRVALEIVRQTLAQLAPVNDAGLIG
ncbi:MAG: PLP-dependent aminotransferase family protein [Acetobacteraceae bacterium]